jgi:hypothetical protein
LEPCFDDLEKSAKETLESVAMGNAEDDIKQEQHQEGDQYVALGFLLPLWKHEENQ